MTRHSASCRGQQLGGQQLPWGCRGQWQIFFSTWQHPPTRTKVTTLINFSIIFNKDLLWSTGHKITSFFESVSEGWIFRLIKDLQTVHDWLWTTRTTRCFIMSGCQFDIYWYWILEAWLAWVHTHTAPPSEEPCDAVSQSVMCQQFYQDPQHRRLGDQRCQCWLAVALDLEQPSPLDGWVQIPTVLLQLGGRCP